MRMNIYGRDYDVIGTATTRSGAEVPVLDIPMMSDEEWQRMAREGAVKNYRKYVGKEPESVEEACKWQRNWCESQMEVERPLHGYRNG